MNQTFMTVLPYPLQNVELFGSLLKFPYLNKKRELGWTGLNGARKAVGRFPAEVHRLNLWIHGFNSES